MAAYTVLYRWLLQLKWSISQEQPLIIANTGGIRFDLVQGPFTYDDSFIVSHFTDSFLYIPKVPYQYASQVVDTLNTLPTSKERSSESLEYTPDFNGADGCYDTPYILADAESRLYSHEAESKTRRAAPTITPSYVMSDDFGTDEDDTPHSSIPNYDSPTYVGTNASLPATGQPSTVDLIFLDYIECDVLLVLSSLGVNYTESGVMQYLLKSFTTTVTCHDMHGSSGARDLCALWAKEWNESQESKILADSLPVQGKECQCQIPSMPLYIAKRGCANPR